MGATIARKAAKAAKELQGARKAALSRAALEVKKQVVGNLPASGRLRGVGKKGARVGARYDFTTGGDVVVKAVGPVHLIERDTKAHEIVPKKRRGGARGAVRLANGNVYAVVKHPGTKGTRPFGRGVDEATPKAVRLMRNAATDAVKRGLISG